MSNKTQILCCRENKRSCLIIKNSWKNIQKNLEQITRLKQMRQELIIDILSLKQAGVLFTENYFFMSLANIERNIRWIERAIAIRTQEINFFAKKLVIC